MIQPRTVFFLLLLLILTLGFQFGAILEIRGNSGQSDIWLEPVCEDENEVHFEVVYEI